jgi:hypothetical protein
MMENEKINMENINYQGGNEYVLIIIEKSLNFFLKFKKKPRRC